MDINLEIDSDEVNATCTECGIEFTYEVLIWNGKPITADPICSPCTENKHAAMIKAERKDMAQSKWEASVPLTYRQTDTDHPDYRAQWSKHVIAMRWAQGENIGEGQNKLFAGLVGESGVCKTRVASQMVRRLLWMGRSVFWVNSSQFQWSCQHLHSDGNKVVAAQCINSCLKTPVLVLDDIGSLKATEAVSDQLYAVLEHRTNTGKPMIWTSNETFDEMLPGNKISEKAKKRNISRLAGYSDLINF